MKKNRRIFGALVLSALVILLLFSLRITRSPILTKIDCERCKPEPTLKIADDPRTETQITEIASKSKLPSKIPRAVLSESIIPLDRAFAEAEVVDTELTPDELAAPMPFRVALRMRNFKELRSRIAKGEILSQAEMSEKYYPTVQSFQQVATWLAASGLNVEVADLTRLSVVAVGPTAIVATTLGVKFGRVIGVDGKEYTSAISTPSVPATFTPFVVGVNGLQPDLNALIRPAQITNPPAMNGLFTIGPQTIAKYYNASGLGVDGTGQTIAIIGTGNPAQSDLTTFWTNTGTSQSFSNLTIINRWSSTGNSADNLEDTVDIEWASSMAPGAKIRLYQSLDPSQFAPAILSDLSSNSSIHQASFSRSVPDDLGPASLLESDSQYYAALAAAGITVFAPSGDYGQFSPPGESGGGIKAVSYPASDPCVTAVGGTTLQFSNVTPQPSPDLPTSEQGWGQSGGGSSFTFPRPSWQAGPGISVGAWRLVPDVSAVANAYDPNNPQTSRNLYYVFGSPGNFVGTSVSSPIWAGLCALINQARANSGLSPVGLLGPRIYPLIGNSNNPLMDITAIDSYGTVGATNYFQGATTAGTGWDICTGIGTPNVANLISALATSLNVNPAAPTIVSQSGNQTVSAGATVTLSVTATTPVDSPILSYQWRVTDPNFAWNSSIDNGNAIWLPLNNGSGVSGSTSPTLTIANISTQWTSDNHGLPRAYDCVVQNQYGFAYSTAVTITIPSPTPPATTQPAPSTTGGGGGGGAMSSWFYIALCLLAAARLFRQNRRAATSNRP
jgi:kumamolisin